MKNRIWLHGFLFILSLLIPGPGAGAQDWALSTNLLEYANLGTLNAEADYAVDRHWNLSAGVRYNPFSYDFGEDGSARQSMERDGYESDENRLMVQHLSDGQPVGDRIFLSKAFDSNVDQFAWLGDTALVFTGVWHALEQVYYIDLQGSIRQLTDGQYDHVLGDICDNRIYLLRHSMLEANELFCLQLSRPQ
ncbi:MAG: DUF3575 domain-containing protein, partial [Bacteroidales bacterium]|nr:DUF3575 domain-containing protein [Bacteroidales bacterium]